MKSKKRETTSNPLWLLIPISIVIGLMVAWGCSDDNNPVTSGGNSVPTGVSCSITASPVTGPAPLTVTLEGSASGGTAPYQYLWRYATRSWSGRNSSYQFTNPGEYTITLVVTDSLNNRDSATVDITVTAPANDLVGTISATPLSGSAPLSVKFDGSATGGTTPYTYAWRFGDGLTGTGGSVVHTYRTAGSYTATLIVTDSLNHKDTATVTVSVSAGTTQLSCGISASPLSGASPLIVNFVGSATGGKKPYVYQWDWDDGTTSTGQTFGHTFLYVGDYDVVLTVTDSTGTSATASVTISVSEGPLLCGISGGPLRGLTPLTVTYTANPKQGKQPYTYSWDFGDGGTAGNVSEVTHTYQSAGTYELVLTVTDALGDSCQSTSTIRVADPYPPPVLSGPSTVSGDITLTWTFDWPVLVATHEQFDIQESQSGPSDGFVSIATVYRGDAQKLTVSRSPGTYHYRVRAFVNQGVMPGWTEYSNVITVTVAEPASSCYFINASSYPVISLVVDGVEYFPQSPMGIPPGAQINIDLPAGNHTYRMTNGFWDGSSRFEMYTATGSFYAPPSRDTTVYFRNPTIFQLLTQFDRSGYWEGTFWQNLTPHTAGFRFYPDGKWTLYVDGVQQSTGTYQEVRRYPETFSITFSVGGYTGTLYETLGKFDMSNGPSEWPNIEYYYSGQ